MISRDSFLVQLDEILDQPHGTLTGPERLNEIDRWDSVAMITFLGMVDEYFGQSLRPSAVSNCETVEDLYRLATQSIAN
jgi:acyl carrier protein